MTRKGEKRKFALENGDASVIHLALGKSFLDSLLKTLSNGRPFIFHFARMHEMAPSQSWRNKIRNESEILS